MVSMLTGNIVTIDYFEERRGLIRFLTLQCSPFRAGGIRGSVRREGHYWLPPFKKANTVHPFSISLKYLNCQY
jgi:hypothetical protein